MNLTTFLDELTKIARTRSAREAEAALHAGDTGTLNQIGQAHQQLGLSPRAVAPLGGGAEAGAYLNLGRAQGQQAGGLHVEKFYNPNSDITQGDYTRQLVEKKKEFTDTARGMSPEAKSMVPDMYGHSSKNQNTPLQRTRSTHEFVGGASNLHDLPAQQHEPLLDQVERHVISPMKARGMSMGDTMHEGPSRYNPNEITRKVNFGNVVNSPQGPKVLDFLPHQKGQEYIPGQSYQTHAPIGGLEGETSPSKARAEFHNPKQRVFPAGPDDQARAQDNWQRGGITPDFNVNELPFGERMKAKDQALQSAATPRAPQSAVVGGSQVESAQTTPARPARPAAPAPEQAATVSPGARRAPLAAAPATTGAPTVAPPARRPLMPAAAAGGIAHPRMITPSTVAPTVAPTAHPIAGRVIPKPPRLPNLRV